MNDDKLVSVIIPTFRRPDTLGRAIESVILQSYRNIEVIIVDDNSPETDFRIMTEKYMEKYNDDSRIIYIKHDRNKERCAARNTGIKNSKGDYLMFLDNDDEFHRTKIESQIKNLEALDGSWGMNYTRYIRKNGKKIIAFSAEKRSGNLLIEALKRNLFIHAGSNLMVRRSVIEEIGDFDENISINEDIEFISRALNKFKLAFVDNLGLTVYVDLQKPSNFDDVTDKYLDSVSHLINQLSKVQQDEVYRMINLQKFRYLLQNHFEIKDIIVMFTTKKLLFGETCRYILHLLYRRITKKSFGFKMMSHKRV